MLVRPDAGITTPKDLEGKKVGVRAYSVTTGVWLRQALMDDCGLDPSKVTWVVDDEEHVTQLKLPANVIHAPEGRSLADMMAGRTVGGRRGRGGHRPHRRPDRRLAGSRSQLSRPAAQRRRTGSRLLPPHRRLSDARHDRRQGRGPGRASLGRQVALQRLQAGQGRMARARARQWPAGRHRQEVRQADGDRRPDPLPYGIEANRPTIEALEQTAFAQGLTPRRMSMDELFVDPDKL
jgi:4,5-dihydroxyphthalate decarboxylase